MKSTLSPNTSAIVRNQSGQALSEYMIIVMLVVVGSLAAVTAFGTAVRTRINSAKVQLNQATERVMQNGSSTRGGLGGLGGVLFGNSE